MCVCVSVFLSLSHPNLDKGGPEGQVSDPGGQGFERGVGRVCPVGGNMVVQEAGVYAVHLLWHHHQTCYGLLQSDKRHLGNTKESYIRMRWWKGQWRSLKMLFFSDIYNMYVLIHSYSTQFICFSGFLFFSGHFTVLNIWMGPNIILPAVFANINSWQEINFDQSCFLAAQFQ